MRSTGAWWLSVLLAGPAMAEQEQARFQVSAVVPPRAALTSSDWPAGLELTEQDVRQGYNDVAARFEVRHNGARGYLLRLTPRPGLTRHVEVRGPAGSFTIFDAEIDVRPPSTERRQDLVLAFRFVLDPAARPGEYPLPIELAAVPL